MTLFGLLVVAFFVLGIIGVSLDEKIDNDTKMVAILVSAFYIVGTLVFGTGKLG